MPEKRVNGLSIPHVNSEAEWKINFLTTAKSLLEIKLEEQLQII